MTATEPQAVSLVVEACQRCFDLVDADTAAEHCPPPAEPVDPPAKPVGTIEITHSFEDGTLLDGTSRADYAVGSPVRAILDLHAWKWARSIGLMIQRSSRDKPSRRYRIIDTARRLRELGWTVTVRIDDDPRPMAEQEADRAARMKYLAQVRGDRADRHAAEAESRHRAEHAILDYIPPGQPKMPGHHSYQRHCRELARADNHMRKSIEASEASEWAAAGAETAAQHMDRRNDPVTVANRIRELESDLRRYERECGKQRRWNDAAGRFELVDASPQTLAHYAPHIAAATTQVEHWRAVRAEQIASGQITEYGPHNVKIGDWVYGWAGGWYRVCRVNKVSVTLETMQSAVSDEWLTNTCRFTEIRKLRTAEEVEEARAKRERDSQAAEVDAGACATTHQES